LTLRIGMQLVAQGLRFWFYLGNWNAFGI